MVQYVMVVHLHNVVSLQLFLESLFGSDFKFTILFLLSLAYQKIADRWSCLSQPMSGLSHVGGPHGSCPYVVAIDWASDVLLGPNPPWLAYSKIRG